MFHYYIVEIQLKQLLHNDDSRVALCDAYIFMQSIIYIVGLESKMFTIHAVSYDSHTTKTAPPHVVQALAQLDEVQNNEPTCSCPCIRRQTWSELLKTKQQHFLNALRFSTLQQLGNLAKDMEHRYNQRDFSKFWALLQTKRQAPMTFYNTDETYDPEITTQLRLAKEWYQYLYSFPDE